MNRKCSTLLSLGISAALIAVGIWFLYNHHANFGFSHGRWIMPHHMTALGNGMGAIMILFWILVAAAVVLVISGIVSGRDHSSEDTDDPMTILRRRYASGEIDQARFEAMKRKLQPGSN